MKMNTLSLILVSLLAGFAFLQPAHSATNNTAFGDGALENNQGNNNTAFGRSPLRFNIFGKQNTATGAFALNKNDLGDNNTATGFQALLENSTGSGNTATGQSALQHNSSGGNNNTATGLAALYRNTTGSQNTANGLNALRGNTTGDFNSAIGSGALITNTTGNSNNAIGFLALRHNTTGKFNIALGDNAGTGVITADDVICIGHAVAGVNVSGTCFIGNIRGVTTQNANALPVVIDGAGQLGTVASSERFKKDIAIMGQASEGILALRPVTFHYKTDGTSTPQFGLIAEEVAKVNPALVLPDKEGKPYTVRYDAVNAMLLNEFLKEHEKVQELEKQVEKLTAGLQKVSAQLEASKPASQVVNN
ncbi:MAG: tail fiber domain-containing protein [Candidatus Udaeobacter sp.]